MVYILAENMINPDSPSTKISTTANRSYNFGSRTPALTPNVHQATTRSSQCTTLPSPGSNHNATLTFQENSMTLPKAHNRNYENQNTIRAHKLPTAPPSHGSPYIEPIQTLPRESDYINSINDCRGTSFENCMYEAVEEEHNASIGIGNHTYETIPDDFPRAL